MVFAVLSGGYHTELIPIRIGHDHRADVALADVDASRPEGGETVHLRLLVTVDLSAGYYELSLPLGCSVSRSSGA
jgi:hypothetical protein